MTTQITPSSSAGRPCLLQVLALSLVAASGASAVPAGVDAYDANDGSYDEGATNSPARVPAIL